VEPVWLPFLDQTTHEMGGIGTAPGNYRVGSFVELRTAREKTFPSRLSGPVPDGNDRRPVNAGGIDQGAHVPISIARDSFDIRRPDEELASVNPDDASPIFRCSAENRWNCGKILG